MSYPPPVSRPVIPRLIAVMLATTGPLCVSAQEAEVDQAEPAPPAVIQEKIREWVQVRKQISAERADWEADKQSLADLNDLRKKEIESLDEIINAAGDRLASAEKQRTELLAEEEALRTGRQLLEARVARAEETLRSLIPRFPPPLLEEVDDALARIASADADSPLQDRYRDLLSVAGAAGNFDNGITVATELREIDGARVEIDVLYLGLARAWYVDRSGRHAGTGVPTSEGWRWTEDASVAAEVRHAIAIRQKEAAPAVVSLPFPAQASTAEQP